MTRAIGPSGLSFTVQMTVPAHDDPENLYSFQVLISTMWRLFWHHFPQQNAAKPLISWPSHHRVIQGRDTKCGGHGFLTCLMPLVHATVSGAIAGPSQDRLGASQAGKNTSSRWILGMMPRPPSAMPGSTLRLKSSSSDGG